MPIRSASQRRRDFADQQRAIEEQLLSRARARQLEGGEARRPAPYDKPAYNTPAYWRDCARGWIGDDEQRADHADFEARRRRAIDSKHRSAPAPSRHKRPPPPPTPSRQFCKPMATTAARDDRLTPQSKALLQVLVARAGRGRSTDATKTTLGRVLSRCPRSIQRYLRELVALGYIRTQTIKSRRTGFYVGLRVSVMDRVLPFFSRKGEAYQPEKLPARLAIGRKSEETELSPTKDKDISLRLLRVDKPPWFGEFAFR
ncbi:MAG: hypothetical protein AAGJ46_01790 [Planctomycetota bacterium]